MWVSSQISGGCLWFLVLSSTCTWACVFCAKCILNLGRFSGSESRLWTFHISLPVPPARISRLRWLRDSLGIGVFTVAINRAHPGTSHPTRLQVQWTGSVQLRRNVAFRYHHLQDRALVLFVLLSHLSASPLLPSKHFALYFPSTVIESVCIGRVMTWLVSPPSPVRAAEPCGRVSVLAAERRRHVRHLRPAEGPERSGVVLQPGLPLLLHLTLHLHGAVALHRPHHRLVRNRQGALKSTLEL